MKRSTDDRAEKSSLVLGRGVGAEEVQFLLEARSVLFPDLIQAYLDEAPLSSY